MTGLAQKGGSVMTHVRIAKEEAAFLASRIAPGGADLILGCDILVAGREARFAVRRGRTHAVINTHRSMPGDFIRNPDLQFPFDDLVHEIREATGSDAAHFFPATEMAGAIFGDGVTANVFTLGYAYQLGLVPVSGAALDRAIELNNVDPEINKRAFQAGRYAAADPKFLERVLPGRSGDVASEAGECKRGKQGLEALISRRVAFLTDYQNAAYAARYRLGVQTIHAVEQIRVPGRTELSIAVAKNYFKILAYKDEYEVARLYTSKEFKDDLARQFDGQFKLRLHLAPPLLSRLDPVTGRPRKHSFGPWIFQSFPLLAKMRSLRGTWLDPFGYTRERRAERELIVNYECLLSQIEARLTPENYEAAVALAMLPDAIRGFGVVKDHSIALARAHETELLAQLSSTFGEKLQADEVVV
jgi:indolepyruvate ferredoxin oxidoreductase